MKTKKVYLIHGWGRDSNEPWFNWLKKKLENKNFEVHAFDMPNSDFPKIEEWVSFLEEKIPFNEIDEQTYFVGHSIGAQTIMRFLEKFPKQKQIAGCCFVAPWLEIMNLETAEMAIAHPWVNSEIDFGRISRHTDNILSIFSDNDPYVNLSEADKFKDKLNSRIIVKKNAEHFEGIEEIPEILKFLIK